MLLVVDANVVFSALLKGGKTLDIFLLNRGYKRFELKGAIWSNDRALKRQSAVEVLSTGDVLKLL